MDKGKEAFLKELREIFRQEAEDNIKSMAARLVELENSAHPEEQTAIVDTLFRDAHNLKGAARSVDQADMERICHWLESIFKKLQKKELAHAPGIFDALHRAADCLEHLNQPGAEAAGIDVPGLVAQLEEIHSAGAAPPHQAAGQPVEKTTAGTPGETPGKGPVEEENAPGAAPDGEEPQPAPGHKKEQTAAPTGKKEQAAELAEGGEPAPQPDQQEKSASVVRLSFEKMTRIMLQAEELILGKSIMENCSAELDELSTRVEMLQKTWKHLSGAYNTLPGGSAAAEKLRRLEQQHGLQLKKLLAGTAELIKHHETNRRLLTGQIETHLEDLKNVLMLPFSSIARVLPKMARDLARAGGKEVELVVNGGETEIDKKVLEEIKDPLIHLVRNAVDHGIESPEIRSAAGKPARGRIEVSAAGKPGNKIEILVSEDGTGFSLQKIKEKDRKAGAAADQDTGAPENEQILSIISRPGFSTSPIITDVSGRGLGMAIVREKVEKIGGTVSLESRPGKGTVFRLILPAALAAFRGIRVETAGRSFIVPTLNVKKVLRIDPAHIRTVENRETVLLAGRPISYVDLKDVLDIPDPPPRQERYEQEASKFHSALVIEAAGKIAAFRVDRVSGEGEMLQKKLGSRLRRVFNVSGAAILGPGEVVPILEPAELVHTAVKKGAGLRMRPGAAPPPRKSVLIVEDSITSRTLLRNILEAAGYRVDTAAHGSAAWTLLQVKSFSAVVADIEMPYMNGIELTRKIRAHKQMNVLPVILVTTLETTEDRERGIDAGADAYIVKTDFKHSNLLSVLDQLI